MKTLCLIACALSIVSASAVDSDSDGIDDIDETMIFGTDPTKADSDNDGLSDGFEIGIGRISIIPLPRASFAASVQHAKNAETRLFTSRSADEFRGMRYALRKQPHSQFLWVGLRYNGQRWVWADGAPDDSFYWAGQERADVNSGEHFAFLDNRIDGDGGFKFSAWSAASNSGNASGYIAEAGQYSNPLSADSDKDGLDDQADATAETDLLDPATNPDGQARIAQAIEFSFFSAPGKSYRIEFSQDLISWQFVEGPIFGDGKEIKRLYSTRDGANYFRVQTTE